MVEPGAQPSGQGRGGDPFRLFKPEVISSHTSNRKPDNCVGLAAKLRLKPPRRNRSREAHLRCIHLPHSPATRGLEILWGRRCPNLLHLARSRLQKISSGGNLLALVSRASTPVEERMHHASA